MREKRKGTFFTKGRERMTELFTVQEVAKALRVDDATVRG